MFDTMRSALPRFFCNLVRKSSLLHEDELPHTTLYLAEENVGDINTGARANNTFIMFDGTEYIHVPAHQIVDLADGSDDEAYDAGTF